MISSRKIERILSSLTLEDVYIIEKLHEAIVSKIGAIALRHYYRSRTPQRFEEIMGQVIEYIMQKQGIISEHGEAQEEVTDEKIEEFINKIKKALSEEEEEKKEEKSGSGEDKHN